jgi:hypothetical protein
MRKLILGSGLIGLFAKEIFGDVEIIPFGKSRFYTFSPALADDFIQCDSDIDSFISKFTVGVPTLFRRSISYRGSLMRDEAALDAYLSKVYGNECNALAQLLIKMETFIYAASCREIYSRLLERHDGSIRGSLQKYGPLLRLEPHLAVCTRGSIPFDAAISTIPYNVLMKLMNKQTALKSKTIHLFHIKTSSLDFEGAGQVLVADPAIDFFKVTQLSPADFIFFMLEDIELPRPYFGAFIRKFAIENKTSIVDALPIGSVESDADLKRFGIECVGSCAQWDDFMDVSSCIKRLLRLSQ